MLVITIVETKAKNTPEGIVIKGKDRRVSNKSIIMTMNITAKVVTANFLLTLGIEETGGIFFTIPSR